MAHGITITIVITLISENMTTINKYHLLEVSKMNLRMNNVK